MYSYLKLIIFKQIYLTLMSTNTPDQRVTNFLSLWFFRLLSSSLLLFLQHFGQYVLQPSSGVCRTRELSRNFELRLIETTGVACSDSFSHNQVQVLSIPVLLLTCSEDWTCNFQMIVSVEPMTITITPCVQQDTWHCGNNKDEDNSPKNLNDKKSTSFVSEI